MSIEEPTARVPNRLPRELTACLCQISEYPASTVIVEFASDEYFAFVESNPDLAEAFALGEQVIAISGGVAYEVTGGKYPQSSAMNREASLALASLSSARGAKFRKKIGSRALQLRQMFLDRSPQQSVVDVVVLVGNGVACANRLMQSR